MASEKSITELADHLASALTAANIEIDPAAVRSAVASAVRENGWHVETVGAGKRRKMRDPATGQRFHEHEQVIATTLTITRPETGTERAERERRTARRAEAIAWENGDHSKPPPDGVSFMDMLDQDVWWRPNNELPIRLKEMSPGHRRRLLALLERQADGLKQREEMSILAIASGPLGPSGDAACDAFDSAMNELDRQPAIEWLNEKPLVVRLRAMVEHDDKPLRRAARVMLGTDDLRRNA